MLDAGYWMLDTGYSITLKNSKLGRIEDRESRIENRGASISPNVKKLTQLISFRNCLDLCLFIYYNGLTIIII